MKNQKIFSLNNDHIILHNSKLKSAIMKSKFMQMVMAACLCVFLTACQKDYKPVNSSQELKMARNNELNGHLKQTKTYNSDVVVKWLDQQLNMFRLPLEAGTSAQATDRAFAYSGIALYEAVVPGMPAYRSLGGQLTDLPAMPTTKPGLAYHWGASANAALAAINRSLFPGTSATNKQKMDELEAELQAQFATEVDPQILHRSIEFGRSVAQAVWAWAQTDGTSAMPPASSYVLPIGFGLWEKTNPAASAANPFHHMRRQLVPGSRDGANAPALPFSFSADPGSEYYNMAMETYEIVKNRTAEQTNIARYHREGTGYGGGSSIAGQLVAVISKANASLDVAALALAKVGIGSYEGLTLTFIQKYQYNVMRPVTYIQRYIDPGFTTLFGTPMYPEYPAGHPTNGGVLAVMLADVFGNDFSFEVDYYNFSGDPSRHYNNFEELAMEMAIGRVYSGIHYKPAVYEGVELGKKVAGNILANVKFMKE